MKVRVCAAHMGGFLAGFLGPKFSQQESLFGRFSLKMSEFAKNSKNC